MQTFLLSTATISMFVMGL